MLVLEDVHWADDATLDSITVLGRRIGSLPALLVLTFRGGEAPPGHPLHATVGAIRADDSSSSSSRRCRRRAVASLAGDDADEVYAATGGNPFYVTELLASRHDRPSCRRRSRTRSWGARRGSTSAARRLVELVSVVPQPRRARRCSTR